MARRLIRGLFTLVVACSALACVGSAVLWMRGYFVGDQFTYIQQRSSASGETSDTDWLVASSRGRIALAAASKTNVARPALKRSVTWRRDRPPVPIAVPNPSPWGRFGFQFVSDAVPVGGNAFILVIGVIVPSWFTVVISAVPPGLWYLLWRRRRRTQLRTERGECLHCGYDLRGSPARCPECGAEASRQVAG